MLVGSMRVSLAFSCGVGFVRRCFNGNDIWPNGQGNAAHFADLCAMGSGNLSTRRVIRVQIGREYLFLALSARKILRFNHICAINDFVVVGALHSLLMFIGERWLARAVGMNGNGSVNRRLSEMRGSVLTVGRLLGLSFITFVPLLNANHETRPMHWAIC